MDALVCDVDHQPQSNRHQDAHMQRLGSFNRSSGPPFLIAEGNVSLIFFSDLKVINFHHIICHQLTTKISRQVDIVTIKGISDIHKNLLYKAHRSTACSTHNIQ